MRLLSRMKAALRNLLHQQRVDTDLDAEIRSYVDAVTEEQIAAGMTPAEARRTALAEVGGAEQVKQAVRDSRTGVGIDTIWRDVRFALRVLRKSPGFTAVVIVTLALGIGANTAIFSLVNAVLLQSIPVEHPEQLVLLRWSAHIWPHTSGMNNFGDCLMERETGSASGCSLSYPLFREIRNRRDLFTSATAFAGPANLDLAGNGQASVAKGELVSGSYFETLGVSPAVGRVLIDGDEKKGASPVAVLDYDYWQSAFGGNPAIVGRAIRLNNVTFTIVGVTDRTFTRLTPGKSVNLYVPLTQTKALGLKWGGDDYDGGSWWLAVLGRLKPEVKRTQAQAAVNLMFLNATMHGAKPAWKTSDDPRVELEPAQYGLIGFRRLLSEPLQLLMAAMGIVLLVACANVAGLMLVRSRSREREMAVRLALGASRSRVMQQVLTESLLLSLVGASLGIVLAYAGAHALAAFTSENLYQFLQLDVQPNAMVLLFTISVALLTGIAFGLGPALRGARTRAAMEINRGAMGRVPVATRVGRRRWPGPGSALVVVQVALSIVMLTGAGLMVRTLEKLRSVDVGFDTQNILLLWIDPTLAGYDNARVQNLYGTLQLRLAALPGVVSASYSSDAMLDGDLWTSGIKVEGQSSIEPLESQMLGVGPRYFETMRLPVMGGRSVNAADVRGGPPVAVVNQAFVQQFLKGRDPIGLHFRPNNDKKSPEWMIVGVVRNTKYYSLTAEDKPTAYVPLTDGGAAFEVRAAMSPAALIPLVRKTMHDLDDNVPVMRVQTQSETIDRLLFVQRLLVRLLGGFAGLGLGLACIGLYGLLSYEVASRTREIGVRTALGAQRKNVLGLFLGRGLVMLLLGSAAGLGSAALVTRLLSSVLYGVKPLDPVTFVAVPSLLAGIGLMACLLPAWRAMRVDPAVALRHE
jgi:predicted permease